MPLLMDLKCPVEFVSTEITRDSAGHAQAYLTFFNLGTKIVIYRQMHFLYLVGFIFGGIDAYVCNFGERAAAFSG